MSNQPDPPNNDMRRLVVAITDFLRDQLETRTDWVPEDRDCLEIAIQSLEMAYGLDASGYVQYRFARPLLDIFNQVANPVTVKDKMRAEAHKDRGNAYMERQMYSDAESQYSSAIEHDKWNSIYYCNRASSRIEQRNFFEAIADCRQALTLNPDYSKAYARMGQAYALLHRPREAARCFRQALELEPDNERYRNNLRVAESQISRPDPVSIIGDLLASIFGLRPRTDTTTGTTTGPILSMPPSFMLITESHPPTQASDSNIESRSEDKGTETTPSTESQDIVFPMPYGVVNERSAERSVDPVLSTNDVGDKSSDSDDELFGFSISSITILDDFPSHDRTDISRDRRQKDNEMQTTENESDSVLNGEKRKTSSNAVDEPLETTQKHDTQVEHDSVKSGDLEDTTYLQQQRTLASKQATRSCADSATGKSYASESAGDQSIVTKQDAEGSVKTLEQPPQKTEADVSQVKRPSSEAVNKPLESTQKDDVQIEHDAVKPADFEDDTDLLQKETHSSKESPRIHTRSATINTYNSTSTGGKCITSKKDNEDSVKNLEKLSQNAEAYASQGKKTSEEFISDPTAVLDTEKYQSNIKSSMSESANDKEVKCNVVDGNSNEESSKAAEKEVEISAAAEKEVGISPAAEKEVEISAAAEKEVEISPAAEKEVERSAAATEGHKAKTRKIPNANMNTPSTTINDTSKVNGENSEETEKEDMINKVNDGGSNDNESKHNS